MANYIIRLVFVIASATVGYQFGTAGLVDIPYAPTVFAGGAAIVALFVILAESYLERVTIEGLIPPIVGLILGLVTGQFATKWLGLVLPVIEVATTNMFVTIALMLIFGYLGLRLGLRMKGELSLMPSQLVGLGKPGGLPAKILDTSVIIDGRISDICKVGVMEGTLLIPRFVLDELQGIADSADPLKRTRGRRGLDILNELQKQTKIEVKISEQDFQDVREVDAKLVKLGKLLKAKVITNDFNLNKIAQFQGVEVLNINDLANALKPVVLPDEEFSVRIIKEGKEPGQGVGYLDDGTMVVIDNGVRLIGKEAKVTVTSVLQTTAGQMIFTKLSSYHS